MGEGGKMRVSFTLIVPNRIEEIRTIKAALEEFSKQQNFPPEALYQTQLSLEEMFTNVVRYAHNDNQEHEIEIIFSRENKTITVEMLDDGFPFNPLEDAPELDTECSLEDRRAGGVGIRLAKELMTELRYRREGSRNHLTMIRKIR